MQKTWSPISTRRSRSSESQAVTDHVELRKSLGFWDVFSIALGQVIGSGIMVLIGIGIEFTAYAIPFAFVLSACLSIIKQIPVAFLGSAMPATGGLYVYCKRILGPRIGFFYDRKLLIDDMLSK